VLVAEPGLLSLGAGQKNDESTWLPKIRFTQVDCQYYTVGGSMLTWSEKRVGQHKARLRMKMQQDEEPPTSVPASFYDSSQAADYRRFVLCDSTPRLCTLETPRVIQLFDISIFGLAQQNLPDCFTAHTTTLTLDFTHFYEKTRKNQAFFEHLRNPSTAVQPGSTIQSMLTITARKGFVQQTDVLHSTSSSTTNSIAASPEDTPRQSPSSTSLSSLASENDLDLKTANGKLLDTYGNEFHLPDFTIKQIRDAIPAHCFNRSGAKGLGYVARDLASLAATFYLFHTYVTPEN
ncbi:MAG: hypothetical protein Q9198_009012, partial [Flavoplaca austrocitrina]